LVSFWNFLQAFGNDWLASMSGPLAVPFAFAATLVSGWSRALLLLLAADHLADDVLPALLDKLAASKAPA
jgi:hypothetical protein